MTDPAPLPGRGLLAALSPERWERAERELLAKLLTELEFEEVLRPERLEDEGGRGRFRLAVGDGLALEYRARRRALGHWRVDPASLVARRDGREVALPEPAGLAAALAPGAGIDAITAAGLVQEIVRTLLADSLQLAEGRSARELADLDGARLESELRGHPWIVANKGRLGFGAEDLLAYAPESRRAVPLIWLAVHPEDGDARGLDNAAVVREQLGETGWGELRARAAAGGADPDSLYLPVHPWQWAHRILPLHAGQIARRRIVPLGALGGRYLPQQSIRTFADLDHPERRYMKLALSILQTSVYRGVPRELALVAPALSAWLTGLVRRDPLLRESGIVLLGEVASVSVPHPGLGAVAGVAYQHTEMLGAIWREPVAAHLPSGERAIPLGALLHRDPEGVSLVEVLIARSGLAVDAWIGRLHAAILPPLLQILYRHGVAFSPHGQNCMVALRDDAPARLVVKDFVDDAMITDHPLPELAGLPEDLRAALHGGGVAPEVLVQWIQNGLLVAVYRYLSEVLEDRLGYSEASFWASARAAVAAYRERAGAGIAERVALFGFEAPTFVKLCVNRTRILGRGYRDEPERPEAPAVGTIANPFAA